MHLHEYQAKKVLKRYGIPVPDFAVVSHIDQVEQAIADLGLSRAVLKVQVHAGGRGKAGGVKFAECPENIYHEAGQLIGLKLVTPQTGKEGIIAHEVIISDIVSYKKEYYLGATIDRERGQAVLIASPDGGMEIEEIAAKDPDRILVMPIKNNKLRNYQLIEIAKFMGWQGKTSEQGKKLVKSLIKAFTESDAMLVEINPLVQTIEEDLIALDAKMTIDDNALFRQPELEAYFDPTQISSYEVRAREFDLAYVALDGEIGCMVNGAGLAMATMDIIQHYGGSPANFLDVGGSATEDRIAEGFKIIVSDPKVKAILINIFGGIMNCGTLAAGIVSASSKLHIHVPLIVRMEGTNVEMGKKILEESKLDILLAETLDDAAQKAVQAAKKIG